MSDDHLTHAEYDTVLEALDHGRWATHMTENPYEALDRLQSTITRLQEEWDRLSSAFDHQTDVMVAVNAQNLTLTAERDAARALLVEFVSLPNERSVPMLRDLEHRTRAALASLNSPEEERTDV